MRVSHILDTCALLDLVSGRWNNPIAVKEMETAVHPVVLSLSGWEIARKFQLGKLHLPCEPNGLSEFLDDVMNQYQLSWAVVNEKVALGAETLPLHHKDPVDRMILSFAVLHQIPLVSSDRIFEMYGITLLNHRK